MKASRVFEFAKELGVASKELLAFLKKNDMPAKSAISTVSKEQKDLALKHFAKGTPADATAGKTKAAPQTPVPAAKEPPPPPAPKEPPPPPAPKEPPPPPTPRPAAGPKPAAVPPPPPTPPARRTYTFSGPVSLVELARSMDLKVADIIKSLLQERMMITLNQRVGVEIVKKIGEIYSFDVTEKAAAGGSAVVQKKAKSADLKARAPVVTIMGHVDHGKTSLLDAIRQSDVAGQEAGAITQHIGAYKVSLPGRGDVVFLDTPGHEAFTALRARGAKVTDVVVLVVAADDGVMPQTVEAIDHARAAGVPIVVAINKMDRPDANPQRVKQELIAHDMNPEEWGGKTIMIEVSALKKEGLDRLLEMLLLEAEMLELRADHTGPAIGTVLEARMHTSRGPVATVLITRGCLKVGDIITCGSASGRVRRMLGSRGEALKEAGPSTPIELLGLSQVTEPGATLVAVEDERGARATAEEYLTAEKEKRLHRRHITLQDVSQNVKAGSVKELRLIVKADVQGSLEALHSQIGRLSNEQVKVEIIHQGIGPINSSDIALAAASDAVTIGFHVGLEPQAEQIARQEEVEVRSYNIIYEAVEELKKAMEGLLSPRVEEVPVGRLEVRQTFRTPRGTISGCLVSSGRVTRGEKARLTRNGQPLFTGTVSSLRRFKDDVREVAMGYECGVGLEGSPDPQPGDVIEVFRQNLVQEKLRL